MTTKGMEEGAEDSPPQRVETEGRRAKPERGAWEVDAAPEARQPLEWTPGLGLKEVAATSEDATSGRQERA
jgi:hypothetical protein